MTLRPMASRARPRCTAARPLYTTVTNCVRRRLVFLKRRCDRNPQAGVGLADPYAPRPGGAALAEADYVSNAALARAAAGRAAIFFCRPLSRQSCRVGWPKSGKVAQDFD
jgi:hypothetical protein